MMDTILNLGLNDATTAGLAARSGSPKFAANCRRRFEAMFRDIVGVEAVPGDPWIQLHRRSRRSSGPGTATGPGRTGEHEGIPDDLGTAVTVQAMVFGNRSVDSGTGVLFTRNPATGEPVLYGDVMFNAQGEDVVAGTHRTEPITVLDERLPAVARELRDFATRLERHYRDLCDIEFTVEHGKLWMLQCRVGKRSPQAALRIAVDMAEDPDFPLDRGEAVRRVAGILANPPLVTSERRDAGPALATGLPASPGVACGEIVTSPDAAVEAAEAGRDRDPRPGRDVARRRPRHGQGRRDPDLDGRARQPRRGRRARLGDPGRRRGRRGRASATARSPSATGASRSARRSPSTAPPVRCSPGPSAGTVDGRAGGGHASGLGPRARHPDRRGDGPATENLAPPPAIPAPAGLTTDDVLRALTVKGYATPEAVATALLCPAEEASELLDRLVADGLAEVAAGSFRLTADGKAVGRERIAADTDHWGAANADAALDTFLALDTE